MERSVNGRTSHSPGKMPDGGEPGLMTYPESPRTHLGEDYPADHGNEGEDDNGDSDAACCADHDGRCSYLLCLVLRDVEDV